MFHLLLVGAALAADPSEPTIAADGTIRSDVIVASDAASVKRVIGDPVQAAKLCPDIISARVLERGQCDLVEVTTRGVTSPLTYKVRRCPTADGFSETLVSSDDFKDLKVDWHVQPVEGGTRVVYAIRTSPDVPVPQRIISSLTAKSAVTALKNLVLRVAGQ